MTGGMEITLRDVYDRQGIHAELLTGLNTQLATLSTRIDGRLNEGERTMTDHEGRLRALERFRFTLVGGAIVGGSLSGAVAALLVFALTRH